MYMRRCTERGEREDRCGAVCRLRCQTQPRWGYTPGGRACMHTRLSFGGGFVLLSTRESYMSFDARLSIISS